MEINENNIVYFFALSWLIGWIFGFMMEKLQWFSSVNWLDD